MAQMERRPVPGWFWAIAILALLWEAGGCYAYLTQVSAGSAAMQTMPAAQRALWQAMPAWVWSAYAAAVWVGLSGAILLLMRQSWARPAFIVSLVGIVVQFGWVFLRTPILSSIGSSAAILPATIFVVGVFLIWFSAMAIGRGWLR
jgi:hypothetical protein